MAAALVDQGNGQHLARNLLLRARQSRRIVDARALEKLGEVKLGEGGRGGGFCRRVLRAETLRQDLHIADRVGPQCKQQRQLIVRTGLDGLPERRQASALGKEVGEKGWDGATAGDGGLRS